MNVFILRKHTLKTRRLKMMLKRDQKGRKGLGGRERRRRKKRRREEEIQRDIMQMWENVPEMLNLGEEVYRKFKKKKKRVLL